MKRASIASALFASALATAPATADEAGMIVGSYVLHQDDGFFRILVLDADGQVSQVSDQQELIAFTGGHGTWSSRGEGAVAANIIDFAYHHATGAPVGPAVIAYTLNFSDPKDGKYQAVEGSFSGRQYGRGVDPLAPDADPELTFDVEFDGKRIPAP